METNILKTGLKCFNLTLLDLRLFYNEMKGNLFIDCFVCRSRGVQKSGIHFKPEVPDDTFYMSHIRGIAFIFGISLYF